MSNWSQFYAGRCNSRYKQHVRTKYAPFIQAIAHAGWGVARHGVRPVLREEGAGIGTVTAVLHSDLNYRADYRMFDLDFEQAALASHNTGMFCAVGNILEAHSKVDVIHSHGVLEHFCDSDIQQTVQRQQEDASHAVVAYVPSRRYKTPSFGDERLLSLGEWRNIAKPTHSFDFNQGYDICLMWIK